MSLHLLSDNLKYVVFLLPHHACHHVCYTRYWVPDKNAALWWVVHAGAEGQVNER